MSTVFDIIMMIFPIIFFWVFFTVFMVIIKRSKDIQKRVNSFHTFNAPKATSVSHPESHERQVHYSQAYSKKNTTRDSGIVDAPLSEAEKNVLYGK
ncbi:MAG: hypothetical protein E7187_01785 [Erysipelotrichaceae bacterium]|nr:hypothetical protein [Erysipelotrichaceae bacterium]